MGFWDSRGGEPLACITEIAICTYVHCMIFITDKFCGKIVRWVEEACSFGNLN